MQEVLAAPLLQRRLRRVRRAWLLVELAVLPRRQRVVSVVRQRRDQPQAALALSVMPRLPAYRRVDLLEAACRRARWA